MKKYFQYFISPFLLVFIYAFISNAQTHTDLKYFGLKGKVKKHETTYYPSIIENSDEWIIKIEQIAIVF